MPTGHFEGTDLVGAAGAPRSTMLDAPAGGGEGLEHRRRQRGPAGLAALVGALVETLQRHLHVGEVLGQCIEAGAGVARRPTWRSVDRFGPAHRIDATNPMSANQDRGS